MSLNDGINLIALHFDKTRTMLKCNRGLWCLHLITAVLLHTSKNISGESALGVSNKLSEYKWLNDILIS